MNRRDSERGDSNGVDEREQRLARARLAFDQGLREASETGARAARRLITPALVGAALVGGTLLALAVVRLVRRPNRKPVLFQLSIEPHFAARPFLPAIGGAVARLALRQLLASPTPASSSSRTVEPRNPSSSAKAAPAEPQRMGSSQRNGSSNGHGNS